MRSKLFLIVRLILALALTVNAQTNPDVKQESSSARQLSPRFLQIVNESRKRVRETNADEVKARLDRGEKLILVDVREENEFAKDHLPGAIHRTKGVIERDIEEKVPDLNAPLVLYTSCRKWATRTCSRWMAPFVSGGKKDFLSLRACNKTLPRFVVVTRLVFP